MKSVTVLFSLCLMLGLMGCEQQDTYPISGEDCGPEDPVQTLDASDCTPI